MIDTEANRKAMPRADSPWPKPAEIAAIICNLAAPSIASPAVR